MAEAETHASRPAPKPGGATGGTQRPGGTPGGVGAAAGREGPPEKSGRPAHNPAAECSGRAELLSVKSSAWRAGRVRPPRRRAQGQRPGGAGGSRRPGGESGIQRPGVPQVQATSGRGAAVSRGTGSARHPTSSLDFLGMQGPESRRQEERSHALVHSRANGRITAIRPVESEELAIGPAELVRSEESATDLVESAAWAMSVALATDLVESAASVALATDLVESAASATSVAPVALATDLVESAASATLVAVLVNRRPRWSWQRRARRRRRRRCRWRWQPNWWGRRRRWRWQPTW